MHSATFLRQKKCTELCQYVVFFRSAWLGGGMPPRDAKQLLGAGDFDLEPSKVLGDGAYARVILGHLKPGVEEGNTERRVAVKIMDREVCQKSGFVNIALEREICAALEHPNIVNMVGAWESSSNIYFVLEFCGGGELFKYCKKYDLSHMPAVAPRFIGETVLALEYLAERGVLHRDLKPENILLTHEYHVKVADFGTACWADQEEDAKKFTGTAQYMAPELLKAEGGRASFESDLWATGCIIYQLFCGHPPFNGATNYLIFKAIQETSPEYPPFVPETARHLVKGLMSREPQDRLGSAAHGGYSELRRHPFFEKINWRTINTEAVQSHVHHDYTSEWKNFLLEKEEVVYAGEVIKTRRLVSSKRRQLVLTNYPRLFYVEPGSSTIKGKVDWTDDLYAQAAGKDGKTFKVVTKDRTYDFEDPAGHAHLWTSKINQVKADAAKRR
eukprot:Hpha_TRINITY_DN15963_c0_g4::TRINITY_DN15963_c0_g4_i1::g.74484::m.74484/K06276/PDPK1; 3-phosphoinositide dependent protein kinase-1